MIVLAAGQGTRLRPITNDGPKCLVELAGRTLLDWQIAAARAVGISEIVVVTGHRADRLRDCGLTLVENPDYARTNMATSLLCARAFFADGFVMSYGDIAYAPRVLRRLLECRAPVAVVVDRAWRGYWERRFDNPLADAESLAIDRDGHLREIGQKVSSIDAIEAQYVGLAGFRADGIEALLRVHAAGLAEQRAGRPPFGGTRSAAQLFVTDLLQAMIAAGTKVAAVVIDGGWVEIDSLSDLALAERLVSCGRLGDAAGGVAGAC